MNQNSKTSADGPAERAGVSGIAQTGIDTAGEVVGAARSILDEMMAGFNLVAERGTSAAGKTVNAYTRRVSESTGMPNNSGDTPGSRTGDQQGDAAGPASSAESERLVGQVIELAQQVVKVAADASARLLEVGVGPVERFVAPDSRAHDDARLVIGPVSPGHKATGTFELDNMAAHQSSIRLVLTNPLASMRGSIPLARVAFSPNPVEIAENASHKVEVVVSVPSTTPPGRYLGIVRCDEVADLTLVLGVDVD